LRIQTHCAPGTAPSGMKMLPTSRLWNPLANKAGNQMTVEKVKASVLQVRAEAMMAPKAQGAMGNLNR
jgi:hypothetical protein